MILNVYALLSLAAALVTAGLAVALALACRRLLRRRRLDPLGADEGAPLAGHLATVLLGVALVSWPLLYLLLDSYVPTWRGVVCIQGVTRVGTGSVGATGHLPTLVGVLQFTKPALVLVVGTATALLAVDRTTATSPLLGRRLGVLLAASGVALLDAAAGLAYVLIPKRERFLESGCCVYAPSGTDRLVEGGFSSRTVADHDPTALTLAAALVALALVLATTRAIRRPRWTLGAGLAAALAVPTTLAFVREVAAPRLLGLAGHRCTYCVMETSLLGVGLLATSAVAVACTLLAAATEVLARAPGADAARERVRLRLLRAGRAATLVALLLAVVGTLPSP